ncbi:hypothetical protein GSI_08359 [Ganoderma sinense ZZ0214-1]|uniref:Uncharacterized protein n=1 Tax=Ganoderma sinense ZZ0214-1 TaxID=1077348 RepID=A0A2G8S718_9APHY|nr:hypothetical protein GSI_08359 [Ganoderma sinense ZZ0214-1]
MSRFGRGFGSTKRTVGHRDTMVGEQQNRGAKQRRKGGGKDVHDAMLLAVFNIRPVDETVIVGDGGLVELELLASSNGDKRRNFVKTIELQIGLKNYDPQRDKCFSGVIDLEYKSVNDLKKLNKNKKLAKQYDAFLASKALIK